MIKPADIFAKVPQLRRREAVEGNEPYFSSFFSSFFSVFFAVFLPNRACIEIAVRLAGQDRGPAVNGDPARPSLQLCVRGSILKAYYKQLFQ